MHEEEFAAAEILFKSNGSDPVKIVFKDSEGEKGVWLNSFILGNWFENLN